MDVSININRFKQYALFTIIVGTLWFWLPALSVVLFTFFLFQLDFSRRFETFVLLLMATSFGLVAYTTQSVGTGDTDIARYYFTYNILANVHTLNQFILSFLLEGGNLLFELVMFILTRIFPDNPQVLPLFWVTVTYFFSFLTIRNCSLYLNSDSRKLYLTIIFFAAIAVVPFFTSTEIIKQVSSVTLFAYALVRKISGRRRAGLWCLISLGVHTSTLMLIPLYLFCNSKKVMKFLPLIFVVSFVLSFFNFNIWLYAIVSPFLGPALADKLQFYQDVDTWSISFRFLSIFVVYLLIIAVLFYDYLFKGGSLSKAKRQLLIIHSFAFCILLMNRGNVHNFVRFIFGFFPFYSLGVVQLMVGRAVKGVRMAFSFCVVAFYFYSNVKLLSEQTTVGGEYDNSYMDNDVVKIATSNVIQFLEFRFQTETE